MRSDLLLCLFVCLVLVSQVIQVRGNSLLECICCWMFGVCPDRSGCSSEELHMTEYWMNILSDWCMLI